MMYEGSKRIDFRIPNKARSHLVGRVVGIICSQRQHLQDWFEGDSIDNYHHLSDTLALPIGILFKIEIANDCRGEKLATPALEHFLKLCKEDGCSQVLLNADVTLGCPFDLVAWYERHGFRKIGPSNLGTFMLYAYDEGQ